MMTRKSAKRVSFLLITETIDGHSKLVFRKGSSNRYSQSSAEDILGNLEC